MKQKKERLGLRISKKIINALKQKRISLKRPKENPIYESFEVLKTFKGNYKDFEEYLNSQNTIGIILGARGKGKSVIGMKLLENLKPSRNKSAIGFPKVYLPLWITHIEDINEIQNNSHLLIDESGINFNSRESMSNINKLFSKILFISRHKSLSITLVTQNSSNIDVNAIRQADYLILKPSALLQKDFERKKIQEIYNNVQDHFDEYKNDKRVAYIYSDQFIGFVKNKLPSFWNDNLSKSFAGFKE
ncbi:hypothetical protein LCGC14_0374300 [marine sediment metagenome]|uniref:Zona occludens toxin N-terminal domain-containing protein n=1 Tax=marine sediment metagenome TaxID=412755 RepID=A0A0F9T456_9ZZZZ